MKLPQLAQAHHTNKFMETKTNKQKITKAKSAKNVYESLFNFQNESITIPRNGQGTINGRKYAYATLDDTINGIRPFLMKHKLVFTQIANDQQLETKLYHVTSQTEISGKLPLGAPTSSQDLGSRITYLRRYALTSMLGLSLEQDVDGIQGGNGGFTTPLVAVPDTKAMLTGIHYNVNNTPSTPDGVKSLDQHAAQVAAAKDTLASTENLVQESAYFTKAKSMIESCTNENAIDTIKSQLEASVNLTDGEKKDLREIIKLQETKALGTIHRQ